MEFFIAHHSDGKYAVTCNECGKHFKHKIYLREHRNRQHRVNVLRKPNPCTICGISVVDMKRHIQRVHFKIDSYRVACPYCNREVMKTSLKYHIKALHSKEGFKKMYNKNNRT